ncbi:MAG: hypothetical protein ACNI3C_07465 [Candidatus Marinarcus sp.]|uniref:hypothetical protein n=1 Tax=Candidatus Marinarcus sp. TaxID=3100987 RepID=UPI003B00ECE4
MFFIFDIKKPLTLLYYIVVIAVGILLEHLDVLSVEKTIGIALFATIVFFVIKTLFICDCHKK